MPPLANAMSLIDGKAKKLAFPDDLKELRFTKAFWVT